MLSSSFSWNLGAFSGPWSFFNWACPSAEEFGAGLAAQAAGRARKPAAAESFGIPGLVRFHDIYRMFSYFVAFPGAHFGGKLGMIYSPVPL